MSQGPRENKNHTLQTLYQEPCYICQYSADYIQRALLLLPVLCWLYSKSSVTFGSTLQTNLLFKELWYFWQYSADYIQRALLLLPVLCRLYSKSSVTFDNTLQSIFKELCYFWQYSANYIQRALLHLPVLYYALDHTQQYIKTGHVRNNLIFPLLSTDFKITYCWVHPCISMFQFH